MLSFSASCSQIWACDCNFIFYLSILTVVIFRIEREEFWENIVEQLLSDETTRALRLENSVESLHLSFAKSKMR